MIKIKVRNQSREALVSDMEDEIAELEKLPKFEKKYGKKMRLIQKALDGDVDALIECGKKYLGQK